MQVRIWFVFIIILGAGFLFYYTQIRQTPEIHNTGLSKQSEERIKRQQRATNSELKQLQLTGPAGPDTRNTRIGKEGCYSFVIPYRVTTTQYTNSGGETECYARYSFDNPKGAIVVYTYTKPVTSWEDVSGVTFRQQKPEEYEEHQLTSNGKEFLIFKLKDTLYEANVFYKTNNSYLVFNLITKTNENLDKDLDRMLGSLEVE